MAQIESVVGSITPLQNGTRLRKLPQTYSTVQLANVLANSVVEIDQTILYLEADPVQTAIWKDDLWGRVIRINGTAIELLKNDYDEFMTAPVYMAITYHNGAVCAKHYISATTPPPVEPPVVFEYPEVLEVVPVLKDGTRLPMKEYVPKI
jgi:hypothetical protein